MNILKELVYRLRGEYTTERLIKMGMKVGYGFKRLNGVILDPSHCWLITLGDNVTMAPRVHILCHDASTKRHLEVTKLGRVNIGNNVFIGAGSIVLPGVSIGDNAIIGAGSVVTKSVEEGMLVCGNPARVICSVEEYLNKHRKALASAPRFGSEHTLSGGVTPELKALQREALERGIGYIE